MNVKLEKKGGEQKKQEEDSRKDKESEGEMLKLAQFQPFHLENKGVFCTLMQILMDF